MLHPFIVVPPNDLKLNFPFNKKKGSTTSQNRRSKTQLYSPSRRSPIVRSRLRWRLLPDNVNRRLEEDCAAVCRLGAVERGLRWHLRLRVTTDAFACSDRRLRGDWCLQTVLAADDRPATALDSVFGSVLLAPCSLLANILPKST